MLRSIIYQNRSYKKSDTMILTATLKTMEDSQHKPKEPYVINK